MLAKKTYLTLFITALLTFMVTTAGAQNPSSPKGKLEGTWLVTATFTEPEGIPPFKVLITFMQGRSDNEGTLIDTNEFQLTPNPVCTPDLGVWQRTNGRDFIATHFNFCFDAFQEFVPAGPTKIRDTLSRQGQFERHARKSRNAPRALKRFRSEVDTSQRSRSYSAVNLHSCLFPPSIIELNRSLNVPQV